MGRIASAYRMRTSEVCEHDASLTFKSPLYKAHGGVAGFARPEEFIGVMLMSILDQIIDTKRGEIAQAKSRTPVEALKAKIAGMDRPRNFFQAVTTPGKKPLNLIAEVKKASPSAGVIRADFDPVRSPAPTPPPAPMR